MFLDSLYGGQTGQDANLQALMQAYALDAPQTMGGTPQPLGAMPPTAQPSGFISRLQTGPATDTFVPTQPRTQQSLADILGNMPARFGGQPAQPAQPAQPTLAPQPLPQPMPQPVLTQPFTRPQMPTPQMPAAMQARFGGFPGNLFANGRVASLMNATPYGRMMGQPMGPQMGQPMGPQMGQSLSVRPQYGAYGQMPR